jgi:hypothetical protein
MRRYCVGQPAPRVRRCTANLAIGFFEGDRRSARSGCCTRPQPSSGSATRRFAQRHHKGFAPRNCNCFAGSLRELSEIRPFVRARALEKATSFTFWPPTTLSTCGYHHCGLTRDVEESEALDSLIEKMRAGDYFPLFAPDFDKQKLVHRMESDETLANQLPTSNNLEVILLKARGIADGQGESFAVYFIDMAILEVRRKNPPTRSSTNIKVRANRELPEQKLER